MCLKEHTLAEYFELVPRDDMVQHLRGKLLGIQAKIQEYQAAERETLDQLAAVLCCFKVGDVVKKDKADYYGVVTKVMFKYQEHQETMSSSPVFSVEVRFAVDANIDVGNCSPGYYAAPWGTNDELQQTLTKVEK